MPDKNLIRGMKAVFRRAALQDRPCREMDRVKEVFFMRHGKTWENTARVLTGQDDPPLSEEGREEVLSIKPYVIRPDEVFSSDLRRASETARLLFPNQEIRVLPQLRERDFGELQGKPIGILKKARTGIEPLHWLDGEVGVLKKWGVEPLFSLEARAEHVLNSLREVDAKVIMVVSHGTFINQLIKRLMPETRDYHTLDNLHYHQITMDCKGDVVSAKFNQAWPSHQPLRVI